MNEEDYSASVTGTPYLSICIPTFNRRETLEEAILSVVGQLSDCASGDIEIVVSDNASEDGTCDLLREYGKKLGNTLKWSSTGQNEGPDRNFIRVVSLAGGRYCWLFGSDDRMIPGALLSIMSLLRTKSPDLLICGRRECASDMSPVRERYWTKTAVSWEFSGDDDDRLVKYIDACTRLGGSFSYLSSVIVRRDSWRAIEPAPDMWGTAYSHAFILMSVLAGGGRLLVDPRPAVDCRMGNDFFLSGGVLKRVALDLDGYAKIVNLVLNDRSRPAAALRALVRRENRFDVLLRAAAEAHERKTWPQFRASLRRIGYGQCHCSFLSTLVVWWPIVKPLHRWAKRLKALLADRP